jgi:hypothetical protein
MKKKKTKKPLTGGKKEPFKLTYERNKSIKEAEKSYYAGRPLKEISGEQVYKLALLWCTHEEIAAHLNVHIDTITLHFSKLIQKAKEEGKASLRRMQWNSAAQGNVTMLIWLGKTILKQKEETQHDINFVIEHIERPFRNRLEDTSPKTITLEDATENNDTP